MMVLDLDPATAGHVALALDRHRSWCRTRDIVPPDVLAELQLAMASTASRGHPSTVPSGDRQRQAVPTSPVAVADPADVADAPPVALLLRVEEVAGLLNVSPRTVWRRVEAGDLPAIKVGTATRIHRDDVDAYLDRPRPGETA